MNIFELIPYLTCGLLKKYLKEETDGLSVEDANDRVRSFLCSLGLDEPYDISTQETRIRSGISTEKIFQHACKMSGDTSSESSKIVNCVSGDFINVVNPYCQDEKAKYQQIFANKKYGDLLLASLSKEWGGQYPIDVKSTFSIAKDSLDIFEGYYALNMRRVSDRMHYIIIENNDAFRQFMYEGPPRKTKDGSILYEFSWDSWDKIPDPVAAGMVVLKILEPKRYRQYIGSLHALTQEYQMPGLLPGD